jgi:hypothetical protein
VLQIRQVQSQIRRKCIKFIHTKNTQKCCTVTNILPALYTQTHRTHNMEQPKRKVARYDPEEVFYSDSKDEQGLQTTIEASGQVKTVFRLGHAVGTQELAEQISRAEEKREDMSRAAYKMADEISKDIATARNNGKYAQRYTEQVMDTLELIRAVNHRLIKRVLDMERQAKNQEVRAKSMLERIKIQEDIIRRLAMKVRDHETRQSSS